MKRLFIGLLALLTFSAYAGESCSNYFQRTLDNRKEVANKATVVGVSVTLLSGPAVLTLWPLDAAILGFAGAYYMLATPRPRNLVKLMHQAEVCSGNKIQKLYKTYKKTALDKAMSFSDFCDTIHNADIDGTLCASSSNLPAKATILDWIELKD